MNAGTLERLRTHVLPGVRGARTLLYDLMLAVGTEAEVRHIRPLHLDLCRIEGTLRGLLDYARAERNAKVAKTRRAG